MIRAYIIIALIISICQSDEIWYYTDKGDLEKIKGPIKYLPNKSTSSILKFKKHSEREISCDKVYKVLDNKGIEIKTKCEPKSADLTDKNKGKIGAKVEASQKTAIKENGPNTIINNKFNTSSDRIRIYIFLITVVVLAVAVYILVSKAKISNNNIRADKIKDLKERSKKKDLRVTIVPLNPKKKAPALDKKGRERKAREKKVADTKAKDLIKEYFNNLS